MLAFLAISPVVDAEVFAEEDSAARAATASTVTIGFTPQSANASVTPVDSTGAKAKVDVKATVRVQNSGGYSVYVGSSSSDLQNGSNTIPSVTSATTYANMPVNRWGYSFAKGAAVSDSYGAMPATLRGTALDSNSSANITDETRTYMLSFAANIGADKPAGTYKNQVTMSVLSSPLEIADTFDIDTMQEMTSEICASSAVGVAKQLKDTRDGKYYWVAKLADGKCWMTQNLDLDLSTSSKLTAADSDVPAAGWTPGFNTTAQVTSDTINADSQTETRSWSLGDYSITTPNDATSCGSQKNDLSQCTEQFTPYTTPTTANGETNAHYIVGNHYQWNAATAGTGGTITSGQASSSIRPKGWRLPTSNTGGEFQTLMNTYNVTSGTATSGVTDSLVSDPLYFVRGGFVGQRDSYLFYDAGNIGAYWSSTPNSNNDRAYNLYFYATGAVSPSNSNAWNYGFSVRCVAREDEPEGEPVTYSVTYASDISHGNPPQKQEVTSTANTYTFTAADYNTLSYCTFVSNPPLGWSTTQITPGPTSSTVTNYAAGDTITLTRENPTIVLYPVYASGSYKTCAGSAIV